MSSSRDHRRKLYERLVGQSVANGKFNITSLLGFGGMGAVYEAIQTAMNRKVALKFIPTHDPTTVARFEREAHTISKLKHPNTVTVFDFGQTGDGFLYLSMEVLHGQTLTQRIDDGPMPPDQAVHIATQICRSLAEAHRAGIVHRDVKPDNIVLIEVDQDPDFVKVLDFGIAKALAGEDDVKLTGDGRIIGTPRYMSPEQILAEPFDHRSDIYSLGCILFEMLCGAPPFQQASTTALMISHTQDPPPSFAQRLDASQLSSLPGKLEGVVRKALAKDPNERYQTTDELRTALDDAIQSPPISVDDLEIGPTMVATPSAIREKPDIVRDSPLASRSSVPKTRPPTRLILAIAVMLLLLTVLLLIGLFRGVPTPEEEAYAEIMHGNTTGENHLAQADPSEAFFFETDENEVVAAEPAPARRPAVRIISTPAGANIFEDEALLGTTPLTLRLEANPQGFHYRLELPGHVPQNIRVYPDPEVEEVQELVYRLEPQRTRRPDRERREPQVKRPDRDRGQTQDSERPEESENEEVKTSPQVPLLEQRRQVDVQRLE